MSRLKELRLRQGMTQPRLSVMSKVHITTIYNIESGKCKPRLITRQKLARVLGVRPGELE